MPTLIIIMWNCGYFKSLFVCLFLLFKKQIAEVEKDFAHLNWKSLISLVYKMNGFLLFYSQKQTHEMWISSNSLPVMYLPRTYDLLDLTGTTNLFQQLS